MNYNPSFEIIKSVSCWIGADYGMQTGHQAKCKNDCWRTRLSHVSIVAGAHLACAMTSDASRKKRLIYVAINGVTHFIIDSYRMPKVLDALLHLIVAVGSSKLMKKGE